MLLLLLLLVKDIGLEHHALVIWGLEVSLSVWLRLLIVIPSHIIVIHHLILKLLLLLILEKLLLLLLEIPLLEILLQLLLPSIKIKLIHAWLVNILECAKCNAVVVFIDSEILELIIGAQFRVLVLRIFPDNIVKDLWFILELGSHAVDLLVSEPKLLGALHLHATDVLVRVHHHCRGESTIIFEFHCELPLRIGYVILVKIIVEVVRRILRIVDLLVLKLILVLLILVLLLLLIK